MDRLRWGLLSTAHINRALIPAIRASSRSRLDAVASRDAARAEAYGAAWDIPQRFGSYDALLASDVDIVYIPLPNSLHAEWILRALQAGKHVLCEKPLALHPDDVQRVAQEAAAAGLVVTEGFMYRHHAHTARVAELVQNGAVGELRTISGSFTYMQSRDPDVRLDRALGGGALWDIGCYPASYMLMLVDGHATCIGTQQVGRGGVDEQFAATIEFGAGVTGQFLCSFRAAYQTFMRIVGTGGSIELARPFRPEPVDAIVLRRDGRDAPPEIIETRGSAVFVDEVVDMEDAVLGLKAPRISLEESRRLCATLVALHRSARDGRPVQTW